MTVHVFRVKREERGRRHPGDPWLTDTSYIVQKLALLFIIMQKKENLYKSKQARVVSPLQEDEALLEKVL